MRWPRAATTAATPTPRRAGRPLDIGLYLPGGTGTQLAEDLFLTVLVPELVRRGDTVTLYDGERLRPRAAAGIDHVVVPGARLGRPGGTLPGLGMTMRARRARHDVLVVSHAPLVAAVAAACGIAPAVVYQHDAAKRFGRPALRLAGDAVTAVVCDSPATADIGRARAGIDSTVIPWCAPPAGAASTSTPRRFGVEPGRYLLVAEADRPAANLHRIAHLLRSLPSGSLGGDRPAVLVTGRPGAASTLRSRLDGAGLTDAVVCPTTPDRRELQDLLHHAALYVHGHGDGSADALLVTAMASGARIAALDSVFNRDVLGEAGRYVRLEPEPFATALDELLHGSAEDDRLARKKAEERALGEFGAGPVAEAYRSLLLAATDSPLGGTTVTTRWAVPDSSASW